MCCQELKRNNLDCKSNASGNAGLTAEVVEDNLQILWHKSSRLGAQEHTDYKGVVSGVDKK